MRCLLNLRCFLVCFQIVSEFKINFDKSEMARISGNGDANLFARVLGYKAVKFPIKYLGIPFDSKYKGMTS